MAEVLTQQADACAALGSPLLGGLLRRAAADVGRRGPVAAVLEPFAGDTPGSALGLRFAAALHRWALSRRAPSVALHLPTAGGLAPTTDRAADTLFGAVRDLCADHGPALTADVSRPCQTNEPGRSAVLLAGLCRLAQRFPDRPVRLLEVGASAGLNLHVDRYRIGAFGPPGDTPLLSDPWRGRAPTGAAPPIVVRAGCDPQPLDAARAEDRLTLSASVWPDQLARFHRLATALAVAAAAPVAVSRASGAAWLAGGLAVPHAGVLTVVWHSVVWQYLTTAERQQLTTVIDGAGAGRAPDAPLAYLRMEPEVRSGRAVFALRGTWWPGGTAPREDVHIADAEGHGPPVRLLD